MILWLNEEEWEENLRTRSNSLKLSFTHLEYEKNNYLGLDGVTFTYPRVKISWAVSKPSP